MIEHVTGELLEVDADLLVLYGSKESYHLAIGGKVSRLLTEGDTPVPESVRVVSVIEAHRLGVKSGDVFYTPGNGMSYTKGILHVVNREDGTGEIDPKVMSTCMENLVAYCKKNNVKTVAIPIKYVGSLADTMSVYEGLQYDETIVFKLVDERKEVLK